MTMLWYVVRPMARPGAHGPGPGLGMKYEFVLRAGPGLDIVFMGRAGPGSNNSICGPGPGPGRDSTSDAGPGIKSYLRAGPGPKFQAQNLLLNTQNTKIIVVVDNRRERKHDFVLQWR